MALKHLYVCVKVSSRLQRNLFQALVTSVLTHVSLRLCAVRQMIPVIRSNDTKGTPDIDYSRHKRSADEVQNVGNPTFFEQPEHAKRTYRAAKRVRKDVLESQILEKRLRFLRAVGLREIEKKREKRKKRMVVPRVSYPVRIDQVSKKKISYVPRYFILFDS